jgi:alcohol dehydrogenase, iron-dependent
VFGVDEDFADEKATANDGLDRFRQWLRSIGMPLTLKELGVPKTDLQSIIERCVSSFPDQIVPGYMPLNREAVTAIFTSVAE